MICFLTFCSTCCQEQKSRQWQRHPVPSTRFWHFERRNIWSRFWMKSQSLILDKILAFIRNLAFIKKLKISVFLHDFVFNQYHPIQSPANTYWHTMTEIAMIALFIISRKFYGKINVKFAQRKIDFWLKFWFKTNFVLNQNFNNQFWWNLSAYQITNFLVYEWMRKGRHIFSGTSWGMIM